MFPKIMWQTSRSWHALGNSFKYFSSLHFLFLKSSCKQLRFSILDSGRSLLAVCLTVWSEIIPLRSPSFNNLYKSEMCSIIYSIYIFNVSASNFSSLLIMCSLEHHAGHLTLCKQFQCHWSKSKQKHTLIRPLFVSVEQGFLQFDRRSSYEKGEEMSWVE